MKGLKGRLKLDPTSTNGVKFQPDINGPLTLFEYPDHRDRDWGQYFIGADATWAVHGDFAVAQVLHRRTWEQVAVLRLRIDPGHFAHEIAMLGHYYNTACIAPETNGPGQNLIWVLLHSLGYPNIWKHLWTDKSQGTHPQEYGWLSTHKRKAEAIGQLLNVLVDNETQIHDAHTFKEMMNYVTTDTGGYENGSGSDHDDTVMAYAIGLTAMIWDHPTLAAYGASYKRAKQVAVTGKISGIWGEGIHAGRDSTQYLLVSIR